MSYRTRFIAIALLSLATPALAQANRCRGDFDGDGAVTVDEILTTVTNSLLGCPPPTERFVDAGDGTILDTTTGLQWESKSSDGSIHDQDDTYTWASGPEAGQDGSAFTVFLATLNQPPCFAGHCDWRLPTAGELQNLVDHARFAPAIAAAFAHDCEPDCAVTACSCTLPDYYWATPALADLPDSAWAVDFNYGLVNAFEKTLPLHVRAVRSNNFE